MCHGDTLREEKIMDNETLEFQAVQEIARNDIAVEVIRKLISNTGKSDKTIEMLQKLVVSLNWNNSHRLYSDIELYFNNEKVMTCREICEGIKANMTEDFINDIKTVTDSYDTEWQQMIVIAVLIGRLIKSLDWTSKPSRKIAQTYSKQSLMTCEEVCDSIISAVDYELQKPIKDDIISEVIKTMGDNFSPAKASEISFRHFEKTYPGFEKFLKQWIGEE